MAMTQKNMSYEALAVGKAYDAKLQQQNQIRKRIEFADARPPCLHADNMHDAC